MRKVQVVYASRHGGTAGIAERIADVLRREGLDVVIADAAARPDPSGFDAHVIGSAVYTGSWLKEATEFIEANEFMLVTRPVWLFSSGPLDHSALSGDIAPVPQVQDIARRLEARGHMTFGGRLAADAKGFGVRSLAKKYAGDYRDPVHVASWVQQMINELTLTEPMDVQAAIPTQRRATSDIPTIA